MQTRSVVFSILTATPNSIQIFGLSRVELQQLHQQFPQQARLADQRESLRALIDDRNITTTEAGQQRLREWLTAARSPPLEPLEAFCQAVERWLPIIARTDRATERPKASIAVSEPSRDMCLAIPRCHPILEQTVANDFKSILSRKSRKRLEGEMAFSVALDPVLASAGGFLLHLVGRPMDCRNIVRKLVTRCSQRSGFISKRTKMGAMSAGMAPRLSRRTTCW